MGSYDIMLPSVLDEDDSNVLEFLNPNRNTLTGSDAKAPAMEDYNPKSTRVTDRFLRRLYCN